MYALALVCILLLCRVYTGIHCACSKTTVMVLSHRSRGHRSALVHQTGSGCVVSRAFMVMIVKVLTGCIMSEHHLL